MSKQLRKFLRLFAASALLAGPAAAQDAAPPATGRFLIFFDWGKPDITRDAETILKDVVTAYQARPAARIQLTGHSDRSGSADVNRVSALHRARQVRDYLAAKGIPAGAMHISSAGEERPLVPTEDGVREVQNRRVEIDIAG